VIVLDTSGQAKSYWEDFGSWLQVWCNGISYDTSGGSSMAINPHTFSVDVDGIDTVTSAARNSSDQPLGWAHQPLPRRPRGVRGTPRRHTPANRVIILYTLVGIYTDRTGSV